MIDEIQVKDLALIARASIEPSRGLTVITGETGAGKTALLSALKLLIGDRADKQSVRDGAEELTVSGRFYDASDPVLEHVVSRRVTADGRSRVLIDGDMASVGELTTLIAPTVDLCGQHEHQQLTRAANHVRLLDAWIGEPAKIALSDYRDAYTAAADAAARLSEIVSAGSDQEAKVRDARFILSRIDAVDPGETEYEDLMASLSRAEHAESLATAADTAHNALASDGGALDSVDTAANALSAMAAFDPRLGEMATLLRDQSAILQDIASESRAYRDSIDFNPETLASQQERMSALQGLLRAYGPRMCDVFAARAQAADVVAMVDNASELEDEARRSLAAAEAVLAEKAVVLGEIRKNAAPQFAACVSQQMARMEMGTAQLVVDCVDLARESWTQSSNQAIEFLYKPGADLSARPLTKIASGGEISRVMLAVKVVAGSGDGVDTMIFDEVDAGVGGTTALALAEVLADLAQTHQVIVVTHLAQVAVQGDVHYVARKTHDDRPETEFVRLSTDERPAEIARMLSGDITDNSLAHARELLEKAGHLA